MLYTTNIMESMRRGEIAGIFCLIALITCLAVQSVFGVGKSVIGDVTALIIYLVVCATYFTVLLSVQEIVKSVGGPAFVKSMRDFLIATVASCLLMAPLLPPLLVPDLLEKILGLVAVILVVILGVVSIRVAPFFDKLEGKRAEYGKKASRWLKISGWLMATVILSVVGVLASLIADFYMWRLVKQERMGAESK